LGNQPLCGTNPPPNALNFGRGIFNRKERKVRKEKTGESFLGFLFGIAAK
jgi:hypothetical protein